MKKILALLVVTVLLLTALTACGSKSSSITIAVPNDATNEARALLLLQDNGYIKLKDGAGITATINDIAENPKNITERSEGRRLRHHQLQLRDPRRSEPDDRFPAH